MIQPSTKICCRPTTPQRERSPPPPTNAAPLSTSSVRPLLPLLHPPQYLLRSYEQIAAPDNPWHGTLHRISRERSATRTLPRIPWRPWAFQDYSSSITGSAAFLSTNPRPSPLRVPIVRIVRPVFGKRCGSQFPDLTLYYVPGQRPCQTGFLFSRNALIPS